MNKSGIKCRISDLEYFPSEVFAPIWLTRVSPNQINMISDELYMTKALEDLKFVSCTLPAFSYTGNRCHSHLIKRSRIMALEQRHHKIISYFYQKTVIQRLHLIKSISVRQIWYIFHGLQVIRKLISPVFLLCSVFRISQISHDQIRNAYHRHRYEHSSVLMWCLSLLFMFSC